MKRTHGLIAATLLVSGCVFLAAHADEQKVDVYNLSKGEPVPIAAKDVGLPVVVFGERMGKMGTYVPSGYMGDAAALRVLSANFSAPAVRDGAGQTCLKITYGTKGANGWAGLYWLSPANNWAKVKGGGYNLSGSPRLTFWAKGEKGGERIAEVKVGGIVGPYPDTDSANLQGLKLTPDWQRYEIDLTGKDLRHIVGGFMFSVRRSDNPLGATFYLDEIAFEEPADSSEKSEVPTASPIAVPQRKTQ